MVGVLRGIFVYYLAEVGDGGVVVFLFPGQDLTIGTGQFRKVDLAEVGIVKQTVIG